MAENYDDSFLTVNNIETYHAGYKDRNLIWCKTYFTMINADPEFEMMHEIDKWRLIAFIMLELQIKKPVPLNKEYLKRKGFDLKSRPISLTVQMLHNFVTVVTQEKSCRVVEKSREENIKKRREEIEKVFESFWNLYPSRNGKKLEKGVCLKMFMDLNKDDIPEILEAVKNYSISSQIQAGFGIKDPKRFIRNDFWKEWIVPESVASEKGPGLTDYEIAMKEKK